MCTNVNIRYEYIPKIFILAVWLVHNTFGNVYTFALKYDKFCSWKTILELKHLLQK